MEVIALRKKSTRWWVNSMIIASVIVLVVILLYFIYNFNVDRTDQHKFIDLAQTVTCDESTDAKDTEKLKEINSDCIGWVKIKDTKIDYPIMQTKENPQYYLHRGYDKQYSYIGTPFMDERCDIETDQNLIIYGHNMRDGAMFADLMKFKDVWYCKEHQELDVTLNGKTYRYRLFAVMRTNTDNEWYSYVSQKDEISYGKMMSNLKKKSLYFTKDEGKYGDYFITLSTCEYSRVEGRLLLIARRLNDVQEKECGIN